MLNSKLEYSEALYQKNLLIFPCSPKYGTRLSKTPVDSRRELTFETESVPATARVASQIRSLSGSHYYAGVWEHPIIPEFAMEHRPYGTFSVTLILPSIFAVLGQSQQLPYAI